MINLWGPLLKSEVIDLGLSRENGIDSLDDQSSETMLSPLPLLMSGILIE